MLHRWLSAARSAPASAVLVVVLILLWILVHVSPGALSVLSLRPGATISGTPTNVVTAVFVETHGPVMLLLDVLSVAVLAPQVEKDWGSGVFLRFLCTTNGFVGVSFFLFLVLEFFWTRNPNKLFMNYGSFAGGTAALSVAAKLMYRSENVVPFLSLSYSSLPFLWTVLSLLASLLLPGVDGSHLVLTVLGVFFAWFYLRYLARLDTSEYFSFASLFPAGPLRLVASQLSRPFAFCCSPFLSLQQQQSADAERGGLAPTPALEYASTVDPDTERRRQRAMAAIDQRIAEIRMQHQLAVTGASPSATPPSTSASSPAASSPVPASSPAPSESQHHGTTGQ